jgi:predicted DNA-binding protein (MmcQ/YjbR family)
MPGSRGAHRRFCRDMFGDTIATCEKRIMSRNARGRADREVAKAIALDLPDTELASHHGTLDIRVRNRIFATFPAEAKVVHLKCAAENMEALVAGQPELFSAAARKSWLQVSLEHVDRATLTRLMIDAWMLTAPPDMQRMYAERLERARRAAT